jgi:hypothetical protein
MTKLYIIVRNDLRPGLQLAQSVHALAAFERAFPERYRAWVTGANNIVCLQVPNEAALQALLDINDGEAVGFHEPDVGDQLTAIAVSERGVQLAELPLALRKAA